MKDELAELLGGEVVSLRQLAGGASKEAWAVELADGRDLLVRRAGVGVIHRDTLTLEQEFQVLEAAVAAGVRAPRPIAYLGEVEPYLEHYNELTGRDITLDELLVWEVFGNVKWATGCLTQSRRHLNGQDRSVEYAVLGRMAAEMEYELLDLIERAA